MGLKTTEVPWLDAQYFENRGKFPPEELEKDAGQYVAWGWDGTQILASGATMEEVEQKLVAAGIDPSRVVGDYVDAP
jgi:hypothetical protein